MSGKKKKGKEILPFSGPAELMALVMGHVISYSSVVVSFLVFHTDGANEWAVR